MRVSHSRHTVIQTGHNLSGVISGGYREKKLLRHIAMVATFLDNNKPKTSLKK